MPSPGIRVTGWAMGSILIQRDAVTGLRGPRRTLCHSREMPVDPRSRIVGWLRPGGWFLAALGSADDPGWTGQWLGVEMFFSSFDAETNLRLLGDAHLDAAQAETVTMHEPDGDATFLWVLARRT